MCYSRNGINWICPLQWVAEIIAPAKCLTTLIRSWLSSMPTTLPNERGAVPSTKSLQKKNQSCTSPLLRMPVPRFSSTDPWRFSLWRRVGQAHTPQMIALRFVLRRGLYALQRPCLNNESEVTNLIDAYFLLMVIDNTTESSRPDPHDLPTSGRWCDHLQERQLRRQS